MIAEYVSLIAAVALPFYIAYLLTCKSKRGGK